MDDIDLITADLTQLLWGLVLHLPLNTQQSSFMHLRPSMRLLRLNCLLQELKNQALQKIKCVLSLEGSNINFSNTLHSAENKLFPFSMKKNEQKAQGHCGLFVDSLTVSKNALKLKTAEIKLLKKNGPFDKMQGKKTTRKCSFYEQLQNTLVRLEDKTCKMHSCMQPIFFKKKHGKFRHLAYM